MWFSFDGELPHERQLQHYQQQLTEAREVIGDLEQIRTTEGNSVTVCCDNPEAETVETQAAVDVCGDFTGWQEVRYRGKTWVEALRKAADASRSFNASNERT